MDRHQKVMAVLSEVMAVHQSLIVDDQNLMTVHQKVVTDHLLREDVRRS